MYVAPAKSPVLRPAKELKGFDKKLVKKGTAVTYTIHLGPEAFRYYNEASHGWVNAPGDYKILIGASSEDIRLEVPVRL